MIKTDDKIDTKWIPPKWMKMDQVGWNLVNAGDNPTLMLSISSIQFIWYLKPEMSNLKLEDAESDLGFQPNREPKSTTAAQILLMVQKSDRIFEVFTPWWLPWNLAGGWFSTTYPKLYALQSTFGSFLQVTRGENVFKKMKPPPNEIS